MENELNKYIDSVICANCVDILSEMPEECIDLTLTSPPYDSLRDYKSFSFNFKKIAALIYRVTKIGGVLVWVIGDSTRNGSETGSSLPQ